MANADSFEDFLLEFIDDEIWELSMEVSSSGFECSRPLVPVVTHFAQ